MKTLILVLSAVGELSKSIAEYRLDLSSYRTMDELWV